jgi:hypothetical protein
LLHQSVHRVVQRHESLRTRIVAADGMLRQHVDRLDRFDTSVIDLSRLSDAEREARRLADELATERIDLAAGRLFNAVLMKLSAHDHVLVLVGDHVISDASSFTIVHKEIWTLYDEAARDTPCSLPSRPTQFPDYAVWQERTLDMWRARHESYWREHLRGGPRTCLPRDHAMQGVSKNEVLHFPFGKALSALLRETARREESPLPVAVLALYVCAMSLWCERRELLVGVLSHGRHALPELKDMVGYLSTCVFLRIRIDEADSLIEILKQIRLEFDAAYAHYDYDRVGDLIPDCSTELGFNWVAPHPFRGPSTAGSVNSRVAIRAFPLSLSWAGDVFIFFTDTTSGIVATVTYRASTIAPSTIERFARHLRSFAAVLVERPLASFRSVVAELRSK